MNSSIDKLKALIRKYYGKEVTDHEAEELRNKLITLVRLAYLKKVK